MSLIKDNECCYNIMGNCKQPLYSNRDPVWSKKNSNNISNNRTLKTTVKTIATETENSPMTTLNPRQ